LDQLLWDLDYCYWHEAPRVRVPNFRGDAENNFPDLVSVSLLGIPRSRKASITGFRKVESLEDKPAWQGVVPLSSNNIVALNDRGLALHGLKRFEEALAYYGRALQLKADVAEILYNRANTLTVLQRQEEALAGYDQALAAKPDYVAALNNRGWLMEQMKRPEDALASYEKALAITPDDARSLGNRTSLLQKLKASPETPPAAAPVEKKKAPKPAAAAAKAKPAKKKSPKTRGR
jgi:tetratricopeptide (TPR) repeat protein